VRRDRNSAHGFPSPALVVIKSTWTLVVTPAVTVTVFPLAAIRDLSSASRASNSCGLSKAATL
jgi:hypothetical protein